MSEEGLYAFDSWEHQLRLEVDEEAYDKLLKDSALSYYLERIFNTEFGRTVVKSIHALVDILLTMFDVNFYLLADSLDANILDSFSLLIHLVKGSKPVEDTNDEAVLERKITPDKESLTDRESIGKRRSLRSSSDGPSYQSEYTFFNRELNGSELSDDESMGSLQWSISSADITPNLSQRLTEDVSVPEIIEIIKCLRDPFFQLNLFAVKGIQRSMASIFQLEKEGSLFFSDLLRQTSVASDVGSSVGGHHSPVIPKADLFPSWRESQKLQQTKEFSLAKSVALNWQKNLRIFDSDWSPWSSSPSSPSGVVRLCRMSAHRDRTLRRMLFIRNHVNINYEDLCYQAGRRKESELSYEGLDLTRISVPQEAIIPVTTTTALMNKLQNWGDDSQLFEETAPIEFEKM